MKNAAFFLALVAASCAWSLVIPSSCESALRRALDADASWVMERRIAGSDRTLVSTGVVSCAAMRGVIWDVRHPFPETISMTTNSMSFADEDGVRVKQLSDLPHYADIRREADAFLSGDPKAFDGAVDVETRFGADGEWALTFKPSVRQMKRLLESVEVCGTDVVSRVVLKTADGGVSTIRFVELGRGTHSLWKDDCR